MKKILLLSIILLSVIGTQAQYALKLLIQIDTTTSVAGCDDSTKFFVKYQDTGSVSLTHDTIKIYLAEGVYWTSTNGPIINNTDTCMIFVLSSINDTLVHTFYYWVHGYCSLISNSGTHTDSVYYNYTNITLFYNSFYSTYHIQSPNLVHSSDNNMSVTAYFGQTFTRWISFKNDGDATFNGAIDFIDVNDSAVKIDSIWIVQTSTNVPGYYYDTTSLSAEISANIDTLHYNDSIIVYEMVTVVGCLDHPPGHGNSSILFSYGCSDTLCQHVIASAIVNRSPWHPSPYFQVLNNWQDSGCEGTFKHWQIAIYDTNIVSCNHFSFLFNGGGYCLIDSNSFTVTPNIIGLIPDSIHGSCLDTSSHYFPYACYSAVSITPLNYFQYYYDTLKYGEVLTLDFNTYKCCGNNDQNINGDYIYNAWGITLNWEDECGSPGIYSYYITPDEPGSLSLVQDFEPEINTMNNGDTDPFFITNISFTGLPDYFYRNYDTGYVEVKFLLDTGLRYVVGFLYFFSLYNSQTWFPSYLTGPITPLGGYKDSITAFFLLDSFPSINFDSPNGLYDFLSDSRINFKLNADRKNVV